MNFVKENLKKYSENKTHKTKFRNQIRKTKFAIEVDENEMKK